MRIKFLLLLSLFFSFSSCSQEPTPESLAKEVLVGIESAAEKVGEGNFVLAAMVNGSIEIVSSVKPTKDWDQEYRKGLEDKIAATIRRGGNEFMFFQIKEDEGSLVVS